MLSSLEKTLSIAFNWSSFEWAGILLKDKVANSRGEIPNLHGNAKGMAFVHTPLYRDTESLLLPRHTMSWENKLQDDLVVVTVGKR